LNIGTCRPLALQGEKQFRHFFVVFYPHQGCFKGLPTRRINQDVPDPEEPLGEVLVAGDIDDLVERNGPGMLHENPGPDLNPVGQKDVKGCRQEYPDEYEKRSFQQPKKQKNVKEPDPIKQKQEHGQRDEENGQALVERRMENPGILLFLLFNGRFHGVP
jgi:hypothetical protein